SRRPGGGARGAPRPRGPRPHAPRRVRLRCARRAAPPRGDQGHRRHPADRPQGGAGPDQGPVARRRRLPPEAVLAAGACAAGERGAAPPRGPGGGGRRRHDRRPARARQDRASRDGRRHRGRAHRDRVQAVAHADRAGRARAEPGATVGNGVARAARHSDAHRRHARPAATAEAREGGRVHRDRARRRLPLPPPRGPRHGRSGEPQARVKLVTRLFITTSLLLAVAVGGVSTTLAVVDAQVGGDERAVALAGLTALLATALLAWLLSREVARPLVQLAGAARAIAAGQPPAFPQSRAPEVAQHILALRAMHEELDQRFTELRREREETATLIETMADGVLAADARGTIVTLNTAARRLLGYGPADRLPPLGELFHDKPA